MYTKKWIIVIIMIVVLMVIGCISILIYNQTKKNVEGNLLIEESEESGGPYSDAQLDNFEIKIKGIEKELKSQIQNWKNYQLEFKKYIYLNGLVDANIANMVDYRIKENKLEIIFELNNSKNTKLYSAVDITNQTYKFEIEK